MFFAKPRLARSSYATRTDAAAVANAVLIAAPGAGLRIVIDSVEFAATASIAGVFELKNAVGAYSGSTGILGAPLPAATTLLAEALTHLELGENLPVIFNTTGTISVSYVTVGYHIEQGD